jgi:hypothetical protein
MSTQEEWDARFDDEFGEKAQSTSSLDLHDFYEFFYKDIKSFMHQRDEATRLKTLEEVEKVINKMLGPDEWGMPCPDDVGIALTYLTNAITKLKGE